MARVFVSYRHSDSPDSAGRLYDRLVSEFGEEDVYRDVDKPRPGAAIEERIRSELANCDAFVAVVGPGWDNGDPDNWARREIRMAAEQGVPIFVTLVGNLRRDQLPAELADLRLGEAITLPSDYWAAGYERLAREVRASLDAQVLAPPARAAAQALAQGSLQVALGPGLSRSAHFLLAPFAADGPSPVDLLAELPAILRHKGYDPGLTVFTAGRHLALEAALEKEEEPFDVVDDPYDDGSSLIRHNLDLTTFELRKRPAVTLVRLPAPASLGFDSGYSLEPVTLPLEPDLPWQASTAARRRLSFNLSLPLWHGNLLFLGVGKQDGALAALAEERSPVDNEASWWVVGVPAVAANGWDEQGAELVDAELPAYARALRRQVEALPPVES
jgi:hypothetical protein